MKTYEYIGVDCQPEKLVETCNQFGKTSWLLVAVRDMATVDSEGRPTKPINHFLSLIFASEKENE